MRKTFKKIAAAVMAAATLAVGSVGMTASASTWSTPYGTLTGTSSTSTWSTTGTPVLRKVTARSSVANAAPYVFAKVEGYVNNALVLSNSNTKQNSQYSTAESSSQNYVNSTVTGNGTHAVWSASYSRVNHYTYF